MAQHLEDLAWYPDRWMEIGAVPEEASQLVGQVYELADAGSAVPHALIEQLVAFDVQMIEGSLRAVSPDDRVCLILTSVRGDEWDLESDDPIVLQAIQRLPGVYRRPS